MGNMNDFRLEDDFKVICYNKNDPVCKITSLINNEEGAPDKVPSMIAKLEVTTHTGQDLEDLPYILELLYSNYTNAFIECGGDDT